MVRNPWQVGLEHIMNKSMEASQQQHWSVVSTLVCASRFLPFVPVLASLNEINPFFLKLPVVMVFIIAPRIKIEH